MPDWVSRRATSYHPAAGLNQDWASGPAGAGPARLPGRQANAPVKVASLPVAVVGIVIRAEQVGHDFDVRVTSMIQAGQPERGLE
jgi:hypothetical protein